MGHLNDEKVCHIKNYEAIGFEVDLCLKMILIIIISKCTILIFLDVSKLKHKGGLCFFPQV